MHLVHKESLFDEILLSKTSRIDKNLMKLALKSSKTPFRDMYWQKVVSFELNVIHSRQVFSESFTVLLLLLRFFLRELLEERMEKSSSRG